MLFIHGTLQIGGIETYFVRMAKERSNKGLKTSILLLSAEKDSNLKLLEEMRKHASIYFPEDFFRKIPILTNKFVLLAPAKIENIKKALVDVDQIHTSSGVPAFLGQRMLRIANKKIPITIGFYHSAAYTWGGSNVPYYQRLNRNFAFNYLPKEALLFYSDGNRDFHSNHTKINFDKSQVFRLGVVDEKEIELSGSITEPLKIITIGRLVTFKTYNIFMLDVIRDLIDKGYSIIFDIYGTGELYEEMENKIKLLRLESYVFLRGMLEYHDFDQVVSEYDIFIVSGTSIVQAAALGVPAINGIENMVEPKTYGYFSDIHKYEFNIKGNNLPLLNVSDLIEEYINMNEQQRLILKNCHVESIKEFTNESCQNSLDELKSIRALNNYFNFNVYIYEFSRLIDKVNRRFNKSHPLNIRPDVLNRK